MTVRKLKGKWFLLVAALSLPFVQPGATEQTEQARLSAILKKSEEYCRRLEKAALDFVCQEEVKEASRYYASQTDVYRYDYQFSRMVQSEDHSPQANVYLYDYQFIRKNLETKEKRDLVSVNGKKKISRIPPCIRTWFFIKTSSWAQAGF